MNMLMTALMTWLVANYDLPPAASLPNVQMLSTVEIGIRHHEVTRPEVFSHLPLERLNEVVAAYDTRDDTILLAEGWQPDTPAALSVLVHELVHHLQSSADLRYACPQEREQLAYAAQEKWLGQFGTSLHEAFGIDRLTLFVLTHCGL